MDLLVDILSRIRRDGAMFYGLSVNDHLDYIKGLYDTFEEQYLMVSRLREKVQCNQADCRRIIEFLLQNNYIASDLSTDSFISEHFMFNGKKKTKDDVRKFPRGDADGISILDENFSLKIPIR